MYAPEGTPLYACINGIVLDKYVSGSYGNTLTIKGNYGGKDYYFFYAHLKQESIFKIGDSISAGKIIGHSGKTGSSAKNLRKNQVHLHFEVRTKSTRTGNRVNPLDIISELKSSIIMNLKKEDQP